MRQIDRVTGWAWREGELTLETPEGRVRLVPMTEDLIRFRVEAAEGGLVLPSEAVVRTGWPAVAAEVEESAGRLLLRTVKVRVEVELSPLRLSWYEGERLFARDEQVLVAADGVLVRRTLPPEERFYGFGEKTGFLDKRGRRLMQWATDETEHTEDRDPLYQAIPFFMGLNQGAAHGLFVDCTARTLYDLGQLDPAATYTIEVKSPVYDAYVFAGPSIAAILERYTDLTGRMELPPLWALGYHQCRWSYFPRARVEEVAQNFRAKDIPCDVLWLDIDYMDGYRVFTWDEERFPRPAEMIQQLGDQGFRVVTIVDPGVKVDEQYGVFAEGMAKGYFVRNPDGSVHVGKVWPGASVFPDWYRPEARRWWGDLHQEAYFDKGVAGIWNDMNEPASFIHNEQGERTLPHDVLQGEDGRQVRHKEVHNAYGFGMCRATYEGMKRHRPERRPFILTRSGYAGIQRYAAVWLGDNKSWWNHLLHAMPMCLNMGLSGVSFVGVDVGGFFGDPNGELVARWIQLGAFTPFLRMHSAAGTRDQEPWSFGERVEEICRRYITLRYRLLPFFYTLFEESHRTGMPVMRPLLLEHQDDPETYGLSDQFLVGRDVLVAPICQPDTTRRAVYLPEGSWYNFWTGERYEGKQYILAEAALDTLPLYIRAGGVLPMGPAMPFVGAVPADTLTLHVFAGADGSFTLYEDEGEGYGYTGGVSARTAITVAGDRVEVGKPQGGYTPPWQQVELLIRGGGERVQVDGRSQATTPAEGRARRVLLPGRGGFTLQLQ